MLLPAPAYDDVNPCVWTFSVYIQNVDGCLGIRRGTRESVNRSQVDIKRKTCDIRTWTKYSFLDISSTLIDTLVPSLYENVESCSIEVF
jgi:hypothetical protein